MRGGGTTGDRIEPAAKAAILADAKIKQHHKKQNRQDVADLERRGKTREKGKKKKREEKKVIKGLDGRTGKR